MGGNPLIINKFDYEVLTDTWEGPRGAAYNVSSEYCQENGLLSWSGEVTSKGYEQINKYKEIISNSS